MTENPTPTYHYLIGYVSSDGGFGRLDIFLTASIATGQDIAAIERDVRNYLNQPHLFVLSFSLLSIRTATEDKR